jgi:hypothetical protein
MDVPSSVSAAWTAHGTGLVQSKKLPSGGLEKEVVRAEVGNPGAGGADGCGIPVQADRRSRLVFRVMKEEEFAKCARLR